jgi:uncharacterized lipoprotein NlpE involved in copper resistance
MKYTFFALGFLAFAWGSCNSENNTDAPTDSVAITESSPMPDTAHNSQNSLDYTGTYTGVLPCADCPGIKTEITLNADGSFTKKMTYLESKEGGIFKDKGTFSWDAAGKRITLEGILAPNHYFVGENTLTQLDREGKKVEGDLANLYVLKK